MKPNSKRQAGANADSSTKADDTGNVRRHNTNALVSCCLLSCGTIVKPKLLNIEGMITCQSLRFEKVQYEVTYFLNGDYKTIWMNENEFDIVNGTRQKIGFVKNSS